jgi:hypothetical protein
MASLVDQLDLFPREVGRCPLNPTQWHAWMPALFVETHHKDGVGVLSTICACGARKLWRCEPKFLS